MTYLQMVNNVLKRLRENEVATVNANSYSKLIGVLINDAKKEVEDSWDWSALRTTITATTSPSTFSYVLSNSGNNVKVLEVLNDTQDLYLTYKDASWMTRQFLLTTPEEGSPMFYSFNGVDNDGDTVVDVYPIPDSVETIRFNVIQRTGELENDTDVLSIPSQPVLLMAYAKAIEERGEDGGIGASSAYMTAGRSLNDAISLDAIKHPEELIWQEV